MNTMSPNNSAEVENLIVDFPQGPRRKSHNHQPVNQTLYAMLHWNLQPKQSTKKSKQKPHPQEKRVRFAKASSTLHRANFTAEDGELALSCSTWYSKSDYKIFRATIKTDIQTLRRITSGRMIEDPNQEYVFTGIEHLAAKTLVRKTVEYRIAHKDAVLGEYRRQKASGIVDLKRLRNASNSFSKLGKVKALILAGNTEDAQE